MEVEVLHDDAEGEAADARVSDGREAAVAGVGARDPHLKRDGAAARNILRLRRKALLEGAVTAVLGASDPRCGEGGETVAGEVTRGLTASSMPLDVQVSPHS